jgi:hypothetical protein
MDPTEAPATVLAEWLTARSPSRPAPLTAADLDDWRRRELNGWTLFEMPGFTNTMFLVRGPAVYEFQPSLQSVDEALAAAGAIG